MEKIERHAVRLQELIEKVRRESVPQNLDTKRITVLHQKWCGHKDSHKHGAEDKYSTNVSMGALFAVDEILDILEEILEID